MAFTFAMNYHPEYQRRHGACAICHQGIEAGAKIIVGTGYFNKHLIRNHNHYGCWRDEVEKRTINWFFENEFKPKGMNQEQKMELNRLRAKRYYIQKKGGEPNDVTKELEEVKRQIAMVKVG